MKRDCRFDDHFSLRIDPLDVEMVIMLVRLVSHEQIDVIPILQFQNCSTVIKEPQDPLSGIEKIGEFFGE